jgi:teichuronic acid biosynthesis glycosyltransferase TuaC
VFHVLFPANSGDPVKRPQLAQSAVDTLNRQGLRAEMHALHGVPHHRVPVWLNASDALLLTSAHEGSPNIIKEALACNVPVVSVDVGDVRERIAGIKGCHIAPPLPEALAAGLRQVHAGPRRVEGRGTLDELSLEGVAARLRAFYQAILRKDA